MASKAKAAPSTTVARRNVIFDGQEYTEVKEGLGRILIPVSLKEDPEEEAAPNGEAPQSVFYNPIQQFNRDLTVLAIKAYGEDVVAQRRKVMEDRVSRRKRKRSDLDEGGPQKQEKTSHPPDGAGINAPNGVSQALAGESMDLSGDHNSKPDGAKDDAVIAAEKATEVAPTNGQAPPARQDVPHRDGASGEGPHQRKLDPPRFTILDALSATGLRALRYVQEIPFVTSVTANDLMPSAVEAIKRNAAHNDVQPKVNVTQGDARAHMYSVIAQDLATEHEKNPQGYRGKSARITQKYDVIDLDPYGTAATFIDSALHAVRDDGGLLCVTCTDSGVWASHGYAEKTFALYGGIPVKGWYSHEAGLRLVLNKIATTAATHGLAIEPLLSLSIDYYIRIFVRVRKSPAAVKFLAGKTMIVYSCDQGCGAWETQLLLRNKKAANSKGTGMFYKHGLSQAPTADQFCRHCGTKMHLAGPMYAGPLHSAGFIERILKDLPNASKDIYGTTARIEGMLTTALEESLPPPADDTASIKDDELAAIEPYPFYFHPTSLAGTIHCTCPDEESLRGALRGLGYEVTRSHCKPGSLRTNAPWAVIWHVMREWTRQKAPVREDKIKAGSPAYRLLRLDRKKAAEEKGADEEVDEVDKLEVVFNQALGREKPRKGLVRYQMNPKENWGPLSRARG